jgi:hypothetical protein
MTETMAAYMRRVERRTRLVNALIVAVGVAIGVCLGCILFGCGGSTTTDYAALCARLCQPRGGVDHQAGKWCRCRNGIDVDLTAGGGAA